MFVSDMSNFPFKKIPIEFVNSEFLSRFKVSIVVESGYIYSVNMNPTHSAMQNCNSMACKFFHLRSLLMFSGAWFCYCKFVWPYMRVIAFGGNLLLFFTYKAMVLYSDIRTLSHIRPWAYMRVNTVYFTYRYTIFLTAFLGFSYIWLY